MVLSRSGDYSKRLEVLDDRGSPDGSDTSDSIESMSFAWLWVDALCIDQDNIDERTSQVLLMGNIYAAAQQVDVWLGESLDNIEGFLVVHNELLPALWKLVEDGNNEGLKGRMR